MIDKYKKFIERVDDHHWDDGYDTSGEYVPGMSSGSNWGNDTPPYDDDDEDEEEGMETICSLIRGVLRNKGIEDFTVSNKRFDIFIEVVTNIEERLNDIIAIFDVIARLKTDIIPQYDSEFDMYQTRKAENILEFGFYLNDGNTKKHSDDDDYERLRKDFNKSFTLTKGKDKDDDNWDPNIHTGLPF